MVVMTNTNTSEAAGVLAPMPVARSHRSPGPERRTTCSPVRFRTRTSNMSTSPRQLVDSAAGRPAAASAAWSSAGSRRIPGLDHLDLRFDA